MDRPWYFGSRKATPDLEALRSGYGKHSVSKHRFKFVEDRFAQSDRTVADHAGYGAADRVFCVAVFLDEGRHAG